MSDFLQAGQHPDADQLTAFVEHTLPKHEQQQTLAHLAECPACRQIIGLSLAPELPVVQPEGLRAGWFSGWRLAWSGVPLLATVLLVLLFVHQRNPASRDSAPLSQPAATPQMVAHSAEPQAPLLQQKQRVSPARRPAPAAAGEMVRNTPEGVTGGVMGGILGGIGAAPPPAPVPAPLASFASNRGQFAQIRPAPLPSGLPTISIASRGNQRLAIDAHHTVFLSEDEGRNWKAVPSQWQGRAMQVALTTTAPAADTVQPVPAKTLSAGSSGAIAGSSSSSLSGTVTDPGGGVVPGATVTAFNAANQSSQVALTDPQGHFQLGLLAPGRYQVEAEALGFMKQSQTEEVAAAQPAVVNFALKLGAAAQTVTVQSASPSVGLLTTAPSLDLPPFELTSDDGGRWTSDDGQSWSRK